MRDYYILGIIVCLFFVQCNPQKPDALLEEEERLFQSERNDVEDDINAKWRERQYTYPSNDSLFHGNTYLAVYSEIYARSEKRTYPLTSTISIRNTSLQDSVFINKSEYYNTHGELITTYFDKTIYVAPMETVEIVVAEDHEQGGSGGNFVFHWSSRNPKNKPYFEAVMISANGQQGISITTRGFDLE